MTNNHVGQPMVCGSILPPSFTKLNIKELSPEAKFRLRFIDNYLTQTHNASQTCRLFGITRSLLYKWLKRFNPRNLASLENQSSRPHRLRSASYDLETVRLVRRYREGKDTATYSARKLSIIFKRDYEPKFHISRSTIGRIIKRFNLFFTEAIKAHKRRSKLARQRWNALKARKPYGLTANQPRSLIEFDMKHIYLPGGQRYYAFCAIDVLTKESIIHTARNCSSYQAKLALEKVVASFGKKVTILNDNGSENMGQAWQYLEQQNITQYFARPHTPKDKPYIERLIGSLQRECLEQRRDDITSLQDLDYYITRWLNNYHYVRPHDSLDGLTPSEYCDRLNLTIERRRVSMR
jgi:transposase InsO family protein